MRERTQALIEPQRPMLVVLGTLAAFLMAATWATAGQIGLGDPQINGNTVVVPVVLQADASGDVSTLDFRVRYDPSQLRPVMARPGPSAQNADKDVMGNERGPGEFSVVMMGLNRNVVSDGEVANITFERIGQGNAADVRITQTTLANPDALEIPSRGSSRTINFDGSPSSPDNTPDQQAENRDAQGRDTSTSPDQTQTNQTNTAGQSPSPSTTADGSPIGGPAAPIPARQAAGQQPRLTLPGAGGTAIAGQQGQEQDSGAAGTTGSSDAQRRLQGAIASADAARSAVDAPSGTAGGQDGSTAGSTTHGSAGEGAEPAQGQTVDAHIQVAQVRATTEAGQSARQEAGASPGAAAAQPPQASAPMLPLFIALGTAAVAVLALFVVRKKLFA